MLYYINQPLDISLGVFLVLLVLSIAFGCVVYNAIMGVIEFKEWLKGRYIEYLMNKGR